ncbi:hypothetical protein [Acrocarpospora sp. B8E8]|uniref:hypothetical protein n=1 Tax=Acrocarpospora sp. B8E8 TaxID=3153572 RepID=UPI00325F131A
MRRPPSQVLIQKGSFGVPVTAAEPEQAYEQGGGQREKNHGDAGADQDLSGVDPVQ